VLRLRALRVHPLVLGREVARELRHRFHVGPRLCRAKLQLMRDRQIRGHLRIRTRSSPAPVLQIRATGPPVSSTAYASSTRRSSPSPALTYASVLAMLRCLMAAFTSSTSCVAA